MVECRNAYPVGAIFFRFFFLTPAVLPRVRQPPPAGIRPSFFTSMWIRSPGLACSHRCGAGFRTVSPVFRSMCPSSGIRYRASTFDTVDCGSRGWEQIRCGPHRRVSRRAMIRRSMRRLDWFGELCGRDDRSASPPHRGGGTGPPTSKPSPGIPGTVQWRGPEPSPVMDHEFDELATPLRGQRGVAVGNLRDEGLRGIRLSVVTQLIPEVVTLSAHATHTTSVGRTPRQSRTPAVWAPGRCTSIT